MQAVVGIVVLLGLVWLISENRREVRVRQILIGLGIQFALAALFLRVPWVSDMLFSLNGVVVAIEKATQAGTMFVFGYLGGGEVPYQLRLSDAPMLFAFRILPQILVFSVLVALLWYWRVLPAIVRGFGWVLERSMGIGGAVGTAAASSVFLGMVETPLVIRGYLARVSRAELFTVMTCGMATVAGSIMVLYASVLSPVVPGVLGHILGASIINVVGAVMIARIMVPHVGPATSGNHAPESSPRKGPAQISLSYDSNMDAITRGTTDGLQLAVNVGAMLVVLISLVALTNQIVGLVEVAGMPLSLERIMGWVFSPIAWLIGIPWQEAQAAGALLGTKLVLNELVAFLDLAGDGGSTLTSSSRLILVYALCGFANFGSLGILLAGLGTLIPERRREFLQTAPKTLISGTLTTLITAAIVGLVSLI